MPGFSPSPLWIPDPLIRPQVLLLTLLSSRVGIKKPNQKTPKNHLKNPLKMYFFGFLGFLKLLIFYENNTNFFSFKQIFYEQISHKLSFIYKKMVRYCNNVKVESKKLSLFLLSNFMYCL